MVESYIYLIGLGIITVGSFAIGCVIGWKLMGAIISNLKKEWGS